MNNKIIGIIVAVVVVVGGGIYFLSKSDTEPNVTPAAIEESTLPPASGEEEMTASSTPDLNIGVDADVMVGGAVKTFTVSGSNFKFAPSTLSVNKGDTVKITFKNMGGMHDFKIDEFKVATKKLNDGGEETVTFVASKSGSFEFYCSIGTHRQMGMRGTLTVK